MMDYQALLTQHCTPQIVRHVQAVDMGQPGAEYWPGGSSPDHVVPDPCHVAMVGIYGDQIGEQTANDNLVLFFANAGDAAFQTPLDPETTEKVRRVALNTRIADADAFYMFRALRDLRIDIRADLAPQYPEVPITAFDTIHPFYQFQLYNAFFGDKAALEWLDDLMGRLLRPRDIVAVQDDLAREKIPGWESLLRKQINDNRMTPGLDGCGGLMVGQNARILLGDFAPTGMTGVLVPDRQPDGRPVPACVPER